MPIWRGGGVDGWILFCGPARAGPGGVGGGRDARGGGAAVRGRPLDRWAREARTEGRRAAKPMGGRRTSKIAGEVEAALLGLLGETNHLTLAECRDRLAERTGVRVHPWTVGRALRRRGWT